MPHDTTPTASETLARVTPGRPKSVPPRPEPCAPACQPLCPACGGLECLCRPRFFPGQLLTDEDLNRLERYIVEKNKLHNRYLEGWGVACGLEVVCDACTPGRVVVRTGYALSPCGEDIVVCDDQSIDVCDLVNQCRKARAPVCDPPYDQPPRECRDGGNQWVIAICYDERPSRGVTALTGSTDSACCSSCGCGGSGSCGCGGASSCGCGTPAAKTPAASTKPRKGYQPQCEPTQICEGYRFTAYPYVEPKLDLRGGYERAPQDLLFAWMYANRSKFGPLLERLLCCLTRALELRATWREGTPATGQAAYTTYHDYLEALREFAADFALHRCAFVEKLDQEAQASATAIGALKGLDALSAPQRVTMETHFAKLDYTWLEIVGECVCSAMLPACPPQPTSNCVPLAVVTVRARDCRIEEICNWRERKLLITWRTVGYWLSWLPWHNLRESIAKLCCAEGRQTSIWWLLVLVIGIVASSAKSQGTAKSAKAATAATPQMKRTAAGPDDPVERSLRAENLMVHLAQSAQAVRAGSEPQAPLWASLLASVTDPSAIMELAGQAVPAAAPAGDVRHLEMRMAALERTNAEYRTAMDGLQSLLKVTPRRKGG
jgi:hypothetical protein